MIRVAGPLDEKPLLELVRPLFSVAFYWPDEMFQAELLQAQTWVFEEAGEIQAFVCLRDVSEAWEISVLGTKHSAQSQGLMSQLLGEIIQRYGGQRHLWLEVHENNLKARKLYEKLGFVQTGTRGNYYTDGSSALLYTRFHC